MVGGVAGISGLRSSDAWLSAAVSASVPFCAPVAAWSAKELTARTASATRATNRSVCILHPPYVDLRTQAYPSPRAPLFCRTMDKTRQNLGTKPWHKAPPTVIPPEGGGVEAPSVIASEAKQSPPPPPQDALADSLLAMTKGGGGPPLPQRRKDTKALETKRAARPSGRAARVVLSMREGYFLRRRAARVAAAQAPASTSNAPPVAAGRLTPTVSVAVLDASTSVPLSATSTK